MTTEKLRNYQSTDSTALAEFQKETGYNYSELADIFKVNKTSIGYWINTGKMPGMMALAVEGAKKAHRREALRDVVVLARVQNGQRQLVTAFLSALKIEYKEIE